MSQYLKYIFYGLVLLLLFHFESLYLGPIKIAHLWKGIVLLILITRVVLSKITLHIYRPLLLLAFLQILNIEIIVNPVNALVIFNKFFIIPIIGIYALNFHPLQLKKALIFFSSFFIFSFVPYYLGILSSLTEGYDLEIFGGSLGLIGPYQKPHTASLTLAVSLIVILFYLFEGSINRFFLIVVFVLGLVFLLATYVRTGIVMFIIGSIPIIIYFVRYKLRNMVILFSLGLIIIGLFGYFLMADEALANRLTGKSMHRTENSFETIGSSRGLIAMVSLQNYNEGTFIEKIFGSGQTNQINRMYEKTGYNIVSHNGFIDFLIANGTIGLLVFLKYLYNLYYIIRNNADKLNKILTISLFLGLFIMVFLQGFEWINVNLLLLLSVAILFKSSEAYRKRKII